MHVCLTSLTDFVFNLFFQVKQDDLRSFLSIAEDLRVRGLTQNDSNSQKTETLERNIGSRKRMRSHSEENDETEIKLPNNQIKNKNHIVTEPSPRKNQHSAHSSPYRQGIYHSSAVDMQSKGIVATLTGFYPLR